ncbi:MAG: TRAP transporter small permease [Planctomycetota bacterium]|jgi:TRAP-type C4-dicarboxylate transport system permease small subunit|nr:TRAP transporter small permease [Planctomycetota bacterium]
MFFKFCDGFAKFLDALIVLVGLILILSVGLQVAGRYVWFIPPYLWPLEVTNFALIWGIFIGSIVCLRENRHFFVDVFQMRGDINPRLHKALRVLHYCVTGCITLIFIWYGWIYFLKWGVIQTSDITGVNLGWLYVSVPFAGVSWLVFLVEGFIKEFLPCASAPGRQPQGAD